MSDRDQQLIDRVFAWIAGRPLYQQRVFVAALFFFTSYAVLSMMALVIVMFGNLFFESDAPLWLANIIGILGASLTTYKESKRQPLVPEGGLKA